MFHHDHPVMSPVAPGKMPDSSLQWQTTGSLVRGAALLPQMGLPVGPGSPPWQPHLAWPTFGSTGSSSSKGTTEKHLL